MLLTESGTRLLTRKGCAWNSFRRDSWLAVDPWEVTRKRIMDYMSVLEHAKEVCHETFPGHAGDITILYMCQASQVILPPVFSSTSCYDDFPYSHPSLLPIYVDTCILFPPRSCQHRHTLPPAMLLFYRASEQARLENIQDCLDSLKVAPLCALYCVRSSIVPDTPLKPSDVEGWRVRRDNSMPSARKSLSSQRA